MMDDWFWSYSERIEQQHKDTMEFIRANIHVMGVPWVECGLTQDTRCFGFKIHKFNSGIIRNEIEIALKTREHFDWSRLHKRLKDYEDFLTNHKEVMLKMGYRMRD